MIFEGYLLPQSTAMGSKNHQKSYILHSGHPEDPFWLFGVTPKPKYGQKLTFFRRLYNIVPLKAKTIDQHPESLHSTSCGTGEHLRATALSTTQRSLNSTLRACTSPHVALETEHTIRPSRTTQRPMNSALKVC